MQQMYQIRFKKKKNNSYPSDPIKTIPLEVIHASKLEQNKNSHDTCGVTAVAAVLEAGPELRPKCKTGKFCIKTSRKKGQNKKLFEFFSIVDLIVV